MLNAIQFEKFKSELEAFIDSHKEFNLNLNSLVTLLVLAWLNEYTSENKKSWILIENKSINWLNFQNIKY